MTAPIISDSTGLILVGGQSRRMGVDKAFLEIDGLPLFERVLAVFRETFSRIILVGNRHDRYSRYGLPIHPDIYPGSSLGGLYTGLVHAETSHLFVASCDLPFPSGAVVRHLLSLKEGCDGVVPTGPDGCEPLFAVYSASCREPMCRFLERGNFCILDLYPQLNIRYVPVEQLSHLDGAGRTFINLNTPEEFARVESREKSWR
jgi:molybdopterin-guanine dinucleotide biosynthesis protein A